MVIKSSYLHLYTCGYGWWTQHKWPTWLLPVLGFDPCSMFSSLMFPLSQWKNPSDLGCIPQFLVDQHPQQTQDRLARQPPMPCATCNIYNIYIHVFIKVLHGDRTTNIVRGKQYSAGPAVWRSISIYFKRVRMTRGYPNGMAQMVGWLLVGVSETPHVWCWKIAVLNVNIQWTPNLEIGEVPVFPLLRLHSSPIFFRWDPPFFHFFLLIMSPSWMFFSCRTGSKNWGIPQSTCRAWSARGRTCRTKCRRTGDVGTGVGRCPKIAKISGKA